MNLATAFQKYAREKNGQLILKFSGTEHLCKLSIENGEAVYIRLGNMELEETLEFVSSHDPVEVSFIKGFIPKKKFSEPITERILKTSARKMDDVPLEEKSEDPTEKNLSSGEMISVAKVNKVFNEYVDIVGPLGAVMLENIVKKLAYTQDTPMPEADFTHMVDQLINDVPQDMRAAFIEAIK